MHSYLLIYSAVRHSIRSSILYTLGYTYVHTHTHVLLTMYTRKLLFDKLPIVMAK